MHVRLWNPPYTGGWIWFSRDNLRRCQIGRDGRTVWWALFGFSGSITL
jgi:hypothetical protein